VTFIEANNLNVGQRNHLRATHTEPKIVL